MNNSQENGSEDNHTFQPSASEDEDTESAIRPINNLHYVDNSYYSKVLNSLNTMRKNRTFCDVILHMDNLELYGHRSVLASTSPQLFELFTVAAEAEMKGSIRENLVTYKVNGYDSYALEKIVDYIYTGSLECPGDKVKMVYLTASQLKMDKLAKECARHLVEHLTVENAIEIRSLPGITNNEKFVKNINEFIAENFSAVKLTTSFLTLPCIRVNILFHEKEDMTQMAAVTCDALCCLVVMWCKQNHDAMEQSDDIIDKLSSKVHMLYLGVDNALQDCSELPENISRSELIQDYKKISLQANANHQQSRPFKKESMQPAKPRVLMYSNYNNNRTDQEREDSYSLIAADSTASNQYLALVSLDGKLATLTLRLKLDAGNSCPPVSCTPTPERFHQLASLKFGRCGFGCANLNETLLVCGGYDKHNCLADFNAYLPDLNNYKKLSPLLSPRGRFNLAVVDTQVYAIGGCDGNIELSSVDRFDSILGKWFPSIPLPLARSSAGVCQLDGKIYCIGGWNGNTGIKQCDVFDPVTEKWSSIAPLSVGRSQAGVCALNGTIYCVGGCDSWNCLSSVEFYDPRSDIWIETNGLHVQKRAIAVVAFRDQLFAIGGSDGPHSLDTTEIYDLREKRWTFGPKMTIPRANCGAAVLNDQLHAVGGYSGTSFLSSMEALDASTNKWTSYGPKNISIIED